ncbi:unnamed protein product [Ilex paraguariensis]|uniref:Uncharacterized protein n=1 Tax=Ilex paraguariensis TaxID=185542 RepID=A0ABC8QMT4_9AQUA
MQSPDGIFSLQGQELSNLQQNISTEDEANLSSRDEAGRKSFPLFLSGEDNSPVSFAQSSGNVSSQQSS